MKDRTAALISFALPGHTIEFMPVFHATGSSHSTLSGYDTPERFQAELDGGKYADTVIPDGTPVLDKRDALNADWRLAISSPLLKIGLDAGEVDALDTRGSIVAQAVTSDPGNGYGQLVKVHEASQDAGIKPGPLDSIGIADFVRWWVDRGAKLGHMRDRRIVWEG